MFLLSVSNFILVLVSLSFVAVNFSLASLCDYSFQIFKDPKSTDAIKIYFEEDLQGFLSSGCYEEAGLNLTEYIDVNDPGVESNLNEIGIFLNGFSHFDNFQRLMSADRFDNGIVNISQRWDVYRQGILPNFFDVTEALGEFNKVARACSEYWVLNSESCIEGNQFACKSFHAGDSFDHERDCLDDANFAQETFNLLRSSFVSQASLTKKLIEEFDDITSETPHARVG